MNNNIILTASGFSDINNYVSEELKRLADELSSKQVVVSNGGHLNSESGYDSFEKILEYI